MAAACAACICARSFCSTSEAAAGTGAGSRPAATLWFEGKRGVGTRYASERVLERLETRGAPREVRADVSRRAVRGSREIRTLSMEAMVERIDRCVRTRSPVDVTTPAATIIAVRARSMSEAEVMLASCARFNESRREWNARCSGECRGVSTPPPREFRRFSTGNFRSG